MSGCLRKTISSKDAKFWNQAPCLPEKLLGTVYHTDDTRFKAVGLIVTKSNLLTSACVCASHGRGVEVTCISYCDSGSGCSIVSSSCSLSMRD